MLGEYVALELQLLEESYLNYGNACEIVAVLPIGLLLLLDSYLVLVKIRNSNTSDSFIRAFTA